MAAINANLDIIDTITRQADRLGKVIAKKALNDPDVQKIMTLPGMGHIIALTVKAEIVDIGRFHTPGKDGILSRLDAQPPRQPR